MNRKAKISFTRIEGAATAYRAAVVEILTAYREKIARAKTDATQYKDELTRYAEAKASIVSDTRRRLDEARSKLTETVKGEIETLRGLLHEHVSIRPTSIFSDTLKSYADFDLQPTETEIAALLKLNGGASLGLRALNSVLKKVQSPFRVDYTRTDQFERDLADLDKLGEQAACYAPLELYHEIIELYANTPNLRNGIDVGDKWGSVSLMVQSQLFESAIDDLRAMSERWSAEVVPSVTRLKDYKDTENASAAEQFIADREAVTNAAKVSKDADGEIAAARIAEERAKADRRAAEILNLY